MEDQLRKDFEDEKARLQAAFNEELEAHRCRLNEEKAKRWRLLRQTTGEEWKTLPRFPLRRLHLHPERPVSFFWTI
jgi:hypothetical protein